MNPAPPQPVRRARKGLWLPEPNAGSAHVDRGGVKWHALTPTSEEGPLVRRVAASPGVSAPVDVQEHAVRVPVIASSMPRAVVPALLAVPQAATGIVVVATVSLLLSDAVRRLIEALHARGKGTLLAGIGAGQVELGKTTPLTRAQLAHRVSVLVQWLEVREEAFGLPIGLLSIGDAVSASLQAAAQQHERLMGLVAVPGGADLSGLRPRTVGRLLVVVGARGGVREASDTVAVVKPRADLAIVEGVTDPLAEAPHTVAMLAADWL